MDARRAPPGRIAAAVALCLILLAGAVEARAVELELKPCAPLPAVDAPVEVTIQPATARDTGPGDERKTTPVSLTVDPVEGASRLSLDLEPGKWRLELRNPAFWARPVAVEAGAATVAVPLWPRSALTGRVQVPRGESRPAELRVLLELASQRARRDDSPCALWRAVARCEVETEEGTFACAVPAGAWDDLTLSAEGWTPHRLPGPTLEHRRPADLGRVALYRGATLTGQLTTVRGAADPESARVWVIPTGRVTRRLDPFDPEGLRERWGRHAVDLGDRGDFAAHDLEPGTYLVVAHQPGFAVHDTTLVTLEAAEERLLREPVVLTLPLRLLVEIAPPRDPFGEPWQVRLYRQSSVGGGLGDASSGAAPEGRWRSVEIPPGAYHLELRDSGGERWLMEGPFHLGAGDAADGLEIYLPLSLDVVEVEGAVRLGDDPLPDVDLWFGGRSGRTSIAASTDGEGRYSAALPRAGEWELELEADEPPVTYRDEVVVPADGGRVDVELPDTRLAGRVVDADGGVPAARPRVRLVRLDDSVGTLPVRVADDGSFESRGLAAGTYMVSAESETGVSEAVQVEVSEAFDPPELILVLRRETALEGAVVSARGGVEGAQVLALALSPTGRLLRVSVPTATTGPGGRFRVGMPEAAGNLRLMIMPPGYGFTVTRRPLDDLLVPVAPAESSLRLPALEDVPDGLLPFLMIDGTPVNLSLLAEWAGMNGVSTGSGAEPWRVPAMPAGVYSLCLMSLLEAQAVLEGRAVASRCSEGAVPPGGELTLTMP